MTAPIAQNQSGASSVLSADLVGKRIALTLRRSVVFLTEIVEIVARVVCEFDSLAGDVERCSAAAAGIEACSRLATELATMSAAALTLVTTSPADVDEFQSALSLLDERCSTLTTTLTTLSPAAFGELASAAQATIGAGSLLDSTSAIESCASATIVRGSRADCEIMPASADPFATDALAMTFDGAAEYINCDALLAGIFSADPITAFTILAFTDEMLSSGPVTIFAMDLGTVAGGLDLFVNSAEVWALQLDSGGGFVQTFVGAGSKLKDEPQVLAAVYDGTESVALDRGRLYLQDEADALISEVSYNPATGSHLASHPQAASPHGYVGAEPGAGGTPAFFLDATIGSFAIWDVALTLAQIRLCIDADHKPTNLAALAVPPKLWLRMGDAPGDASDASSLENAGTAGGAATPVAMDASNYVVWP
jgi:hypothetical protein